MDGLARALARARHSPALALLLAEVAAIAAISLCTVFRFPVFAAVDERAHIAYVQELAEHGRIPWVGRDHVFWQELAIEAGTFPRPSGLDPARLGLRGSSYEGWQPPLYYALAAPAFAIPGDYRLRWPRSCCSGWRPCSRGRASRSSCPCSCSAARCCAGSPH